MVMSPRWVFGDYVMDKWESDFVENGSDEWLQKFAYASLAMEGGAKNATWDGGRLFAQKIKRDHRLKPASLETIQRYWNARILPQTPLPPAPKNHNLVLRGGALP